MATISPRRGLQLFERLLQRPASAPAQVGALAIDWAKLLVGFAPGVAPRFYAEIAASMQAGEQASAAASGAETPAAPAVPLRVALAQAPAGQAREILHQAVEKRAAQVLGLDAARGVDGAQPLSELGLDSLMAVELRNALGQDVEHPLPATLLFDYPTIDDVVEYLAAEILAWTAGAAEKPAVETAAEIDELSADEMADLLSRKLDLLDEGR
jgi:acyl carrier protein